MESTTERPPDPKSRAIAAGMAHGFGRKHGTQFLAEIEAHAPWETWAAKLADGKRPLPLRKLVGQNENPLQWSLHQTRDAATIEHLQLLDGLKRHWHRTEPADWSAVVTDWLAASGQGELSLGLAIESLAWTHALSRLAVRLPAEVWWDLFAFLLNTAVEATQVLQSDIDRPDDALLSQLLAGEFPLTLAYCLPKVDVCAELANEARRAISGGIIELLDGEGMPHARYVPAWRSLFACWTRCMYLDREVRGGHVKKKARLQYEWLVRQTLRWHRVDGSLIFEDGSDLAVRGDSLLKAALVIGGDEVDREVYDCVSGKRSASVSRFELPPAGEHSEWGEAAVLRTAWCPRSAYLGVTFNSSRLVTELGDAETVIWSGDDVPEVFVNHEPLRVVSEWEELCWCSDEDVDYIELELGLSGNYRLQRQMLLVREDRILLSADAVVGSREGKIEYCRTLPIDTGVELRQVDETTEIGIKARRHHGWIMPLALSEWKADRSAGQFDGLRLRQQLLGQGLYAPLFIDLCPRRRRKARTWRQLTVGWQLELVARDKAVAYRVQAGREQWLIYRSLTPPANRTFMGQNVNCEFLVGRFHSDGALEELIEIE